MWWLVLVRRRLAQRSGHGSSLAHAGVLGDTGDSAGAERGAGMAPVAVRVWAYARAMAPTSAASSATAPRMTAAAIARGVNARSPCRPSTKPEDRKSTRLNSSHLVI